MYRDSDIALKWMNGDDPLIKYFTNQVGRLRKGKMLYFKLDMPT